MPRERWFRWKSGIIAPFGCDCRRINAFPPRRRLVDRALADTIAGAFPAGDYIVAVAHGGIPWAKAVADRLHLPLGYVRAQPRANGGPQVEGIRGFPEMRENLGEWPVRALTSYPQVVDRVRAAGLIDDGQASQLRHFYADPRNHAWGD
jgi:orotate phosphoribosyltransferase